MSIADEMRKITMEEFPRTLYKQILAAIRVEANAGRQCYRTYKYNDVPNETLQMLRADGFMAEHTCTINHSPACIDNEWYDSHGGCDTACRLSCLLSVSW